MGWMVVDLGFGPVPAGTAVPGLLLPASVSIWYGTPGEWEALPRPAHLLLAGVGKAGLKAGQQVTVVNAATAAIIEHPEQVVVRADGMAGLVAIELPSPPRSPSALQAASPLRSRPIGIELTGALTQALTAAAMREPQVDAFRQVSTVLGLILSAHPRSASGRAIRPSAPPAVHQAAALVVDQPPFNWTAGLLAERCSVSRNTLHEWFTAAAGCGAGQYLREHRVFLFLNLVSCACFTVDEAAKGAGFKSTRAAKEAFERALGRTVGEYLAAIDRLVTPATSPPSPAE